MSATARMKKELASRERLIVETISVEPAIDDEIRTVITHPQIWKHLVDDYGGTAEEWDFPEHDPKQYFAFRRGAELLGIVIVVPHSRTCWSLTIAMLPSAWGKTAEEAARLFIRRIWKLNPNVMRLVGDVCESNRLSLAFCKKVGFVQYGRNPKCFLKNGRLQDEILVGISRPERF